MAGVNAVEISTFDEPFRTPSHTAHLVAMRTQQVIAEETGVARVADPIGGSWYVEHLTDELERRIDAEVGGLSRSARSRISFRAASSARSCTPDGSLCARSARR